jgi:TRAP-type uncharacterized transport system substrate-binding protein
MHIRLKIVAIPLIILLVCLVVVLRFANPAAPGEMNLLAGARGSGYYETAKQYAAYLRDKGIIANVVETAGSRENLRKLAAQDSPAAGYALAGVDREMQTAEDLGSLLSLGSLSFEPLWLFLGADEQISRMGELAGKSIGLGPLDSDSRSIAMLVLNENGINDQTLDLSDSYSDPKSRAEALIQGDLEAAFFLGPPTSDPIARLLESPTVSPVSITRAAAYDRLYPELAEIVLPEGVVDLANDVPLADLHLLAAVDNLVVRDDLHPMVVDLLLDAAKSIQQEPDLLAPRGTFPNMAHSSLPLSPAAVRFYEEGPSPLRKYLPFWLATIISRFGLIVAQVGTVALLVLKLPPSLLRIRFTMKQAGIYRQMEELEKSFAGGLDRDVVAADLDGIDRQAAELKSPRMKLSEYMELRQNIHDLRERLDMPRQPRSIAAGSME